MCSQNFKAKFEVLPKLWELYGARSSLLPDLQRPRDQRSEKSAKRRNVGRKSLLWRRRRFDIWRRNRWL